MAALVRGDRMGNRRHRRQAKAAPARDSAGIVTDEKDSQDQEVSSIEWECVNMSEQEEDLIYRMHRLVGDRWELIAGRIPGRRAEEIERFWVMRHGGSPDGRPKY